MAPLVHRGEDMLNHKPKHLASMHRGNTLQYCWRWLKAIVDQMDCAT